MKKVLIAFLFLAACGSKEDSDFVKDFGTNKIEFTRCTHNGASEIFDTSVEYIPEQDLYVLEFQAQHIEMRLTRTHPLNSPLGTVFYCADYNCSATEFVLIEDHRGKIFYSYNDFTCYE